MLNRKRIVVMGLIALAASTLALQDAVLFKRDLSQETLDKYSVSMVSKQTLDGGPVSGQEMTMTSSLKMSYKIGKAASDSGKAPAEVQLTDIKLDMEGMPGAEAMAENLPKEFKITGKIDAQNRFSEPKIEGMKDDMLGAGRSFQQMQSMTLVEFSANPVKIGDSWKMTLPKSPMYGNKEVQLDVTYVRDSLSGDKPVYELSIKGELPIDFKPEPQGGQQVTMHMIGKSKVNATALLEKGSFRILKIDAIIDSDQKMDIEEVGVTINMKGKTTTTMKLAQ